jgi:Sec-independent protein translocase protein TatA
MGKFLDKFKGGIENSKNKIENRLNKEKEDDFSDDEKYDDFEDDFDKYDDVGIQPSQKPESFHHFILENQYKDLERSIRGFKDVFDKETQQWRTIRKKEHCFTDEEAEEILRTAQSHLATDIKLGFVNKDSFPLMMDAIYQEIAFLFESIAEYRYGRYGDNEKQYQMKLQNHKIFLELFTRIQANYSRSIQGTENKYTHDSVKGQESLQQGDKDYYDNRRRYS